MVDIKDSLQYDFAVAMVKDAIIGIIFGSATYEGRVAIG